MPPRGIYIHVPFCARKCPYCDFYSQKIDRSLFAPFAQAVARQLEQTPFLNADTLYFGGGTPALLPPNCLNEILQAAKRHFAPHCTPEITIEANPAMLKQEGFAALHALGFNRLSLGVQSLNSAELKALGRLHTPQGALEAVQMAHAAGFQNISCDVMLATPYQTPQSLKSTLQTLIGLPIQHISAYLLQVEEGTPFATSSITQHCPDDDTAANMYEDMIQTLEDAGFMQYEISNFARLGFESRHNCKYWLDIEYLGCGPGAHSYLNGRRFYLPADLNGYLQNAQKGVFAYIDDGEGGNFEEYAMLRLRLKEGLSLLEVADRFGQPAAEQLQKKAQGLIGQGLVLQRENRLSLTRAGCLLSNQVIEKLVL